MKSFMQFFKVKSTDVIRVVEQKDELNRGIGDLILLIEQSKKRLNHTSWKNNDVHICYLFKLIRELIEENKLLKELELLQTETQLNTKNENIFDKKIAADKYMDCEFDISVRAYNILRNAGIETLRDLYEIPKEEIIKYKNCGQGTKKELDNLFKELGINWR
jgi:hypothetical protein